MVHFEHGLAESALSDEIQVFKRRGGPSAEYPFGTAPGRVRVPPFDAVEIDLGYVFASPS